MERWEMSENKSKYTRSSLSLIGKTVVGLQYVHPLSMPHALLKCLHPANASYFAWPIRLNRLLNRFVARTNLRVSRLESSIARTHAYQSILVCIQPIISIFPAFTSYIYKALCMQICNNPPGPLWSCKPFLPSFLVIVKSPLY